jgi:hypothetical protein
LNLLEEWGYGKTRFPALIVCLHEVMLINRSPRLEDLTFDLLFNLLGESRMQFGQSWFGLGGT